MRDTEFVDWFAAELAGLAGVEAVALGGSRALGTGVPESDWDFAIYYRGSFDPDGLRSKGWEGTVSEIGDWGGGVMNGGGWLTIDGRRVDVMYRDLDEVEHWCADALQGRFEKQLLMFYVAGIPTYVVMAELAANVTLRGTLPVYAYPAALSVEAERRWRMDAAASLDYAARALRVRDDVIVALANASRGLIERAQSVLAGRREWVLNEKGIVERAGLTEAASSLLAATTTAELLAAVEALAHSMS